MNYEFPIINNLSDVLPAIQDCKDFIMVVKDDYVVINYVITSGETFPPVTDYNSAVRRECRGMIFDKFTGKIIARRLQKFFNLGEHVECDMDHVDFNQPHIILEKLDGSMITPFYSNGEIRWGTKLGLTDVAAPAEEFARAHPDYIKLAEYLLPIEVTPIFEWCSRKQRIVLDYPEDRLVLVAVRRNDTGRYVSYIDMLEMIWVGKWNIDLVQPLKVLGKTIQEAMASVKSTEEQEGVVIRFNDGHMVKVKTDWYVRLHRTKSMIESEKDVANLILNHQLDDLLPVLMDADKEKVLKYRNAMIPECKFWGGTICGTLTGFRKIGMSRKDYAIGLASKNDHPVFKSIIFSLWDAEISIASCTEVVYNTILKYTNSNRSFEEKVKSWVLKGINYGD